MGRQFAGVLRVLRGPHPHPARAVVDDDAPAVVRERHPLGHVVEAFQPREPGKLAYVTQTTLSLDDTAGIVAVLKRRFPDIVAPHKEDICYATTNRQEAVKRVAPQVDALVVVGAPNSSNSRRLQEVAERAGCSYSVLVQREAEADWAKFDGIKTHAGTAGPAAPGVLGGGRGGRKAAIDRAGVRGSRAVSGSEVRMLLFHPGRGRLAGRPSADRGR